MAIVVMHSLHSQQQPVYFKKLMITMSGVSIKAGKAEQLNCVQDWHGPALHGQLTSMHHIGCQLQRTSITAHNEC